MKNIILKDNSSIERDELFNQVRETHGHIIVSWQSEMQVHNRDLVLHAISLDESNFGRVQKEFYYSYPNEICNLITKNNYYYCPKYLFEMNLKYFEKYISIKEELQETITDTFYFSCLDMLKVYVQRNPQYLVELDYNVQEGLIEIIRNLVKNNPNNIKFINEHILFNHYGIAKSAVVLDPNCIYYLPGAYLNRYPELLKYINSDIVEDIIINGLDDGNNDQYYPTIKDKNLLKEVMMLSPKAIILASSSILLSYSSAYINRRVSDNALRRMFISRRPIISKIKKIKAS